MKDETSLLVYDQQREEKVRVVQTNQFEFASRYYATIDNTLYHFSRKGPEYLLKVLRPADDNAEIVRPAYQDNPDHEELEFFSACVALNKFIVFTGGYNSNTC